MGLGKSVGHCRYPMDLAVLAELPACAGCQRMLTGKVGVVLCDCWNYYCEVCLADWETRCCQTCKGGNAPTKNEKARKIVDGLFEDWWTTITGDISAEEKMQKLRGAAERLRQALKDELAPASRVDQPSFASHSTASQMSSLQPPSFPSPLSQPPAPLPPPSLPSASQPFYFPPIDQNLHQSECEYCRFRLSRDPTGRCNRCQKVNYRTVQFNREKFLSAKWECPKCKLRNVHSNQKCIECGSMKQGIGRHW